MSGRSQNKESGDFGNGDDSSHDSGHIYDHGGSSKENDGLRFWDIDGVYEPEEFMRILQNILDYFTLGEGRFDSDIEGMLETLNIWERRVVELLNGPADKDLYLIGFEIGADGFTRIVFLLRSQVASED